MASLLSNLIPKRFNDNLSAFRWLYQNRDIYYKIRDFGFEITKKQKGPFLYQEDGLSTIHNCDFLKDEKFIKAYQKGKDTDTWKGFDIRWRVYVCCWAAKQVMNLDGDFLECGVLKGALSSCVIDYVDFGKSNKRFFLVDTFTGIPERFLEGVPDIYISEDKKLNIQSENTFEQVKTLFSSFPNVIPIQGIVPEILPQVQTDKVSYLSLDMNSAVAEILALEFFWDKLVKGGIVILDDYAYINGEKQKKAIDEFAHAKGIEVLSLPTGQGIILRY